MGYLALAHRWRTQLFRPTDEDGQGDAGEAQDQEAARMVGIDVDRVVIVTFFWDLRSPARLG